MKSIAILACMSVAGAFLAGNSLVHARTPAIPSTVTVNTTSEIATLGATPIGANAAVWDSHLYEVGVPGRLSDAGIRLVRYPGGSAADTYHWQSDTGGFTASTFDSYMSVVKSAHAQSIITVNYGSGTPAEAAGWVQYANTGGPNYSGPVPSYPGGSATGQRYHIKYWEIGNEIYGNSTYGGNWENDVNPPGPAEYAARLQEYSAAMKAVDSSVHVGAVLTAPGNWPDGVTNASSPQPWNDTVLSMACGAADFVVVHWYPQSPGAESDPGLLASSESGTANTPSIGAMVGSLRSLITQYCGAHAKNVQIFVTETNSVSYNPGKQTTSLVNALFLADSLSTWLENGVTNVDPWAIHNSPSCGTNDSSSLYGRYTFGDYGLLSAGGYCADAIEPPAETPFPSYYGVQMLAHVAEPGGATLGATSSTPLVSAHAVRGPAGNINVLLVNTDPVNAYDVAVSLQGAKGAGSGDVFTYGQNSSWIAQSSVTVSNASFAIAVEPYSLTVVRVR